MFGYHGRFLRVDATTGQAETRPLEQGILRRFLGGVGLGTWILAQETPPRVDPLAREAALVVALSPLVGTPLTTSAKFAVVGKSPLTGRICDALSSSQFAIAAKRTGVDAIALVGARAEPSVLLVESAGRTGTAASWVSAHELWGLSAQETEDRLRATLGQEWQIVAIGPAGERQIPFANLSHDGRHAGRGGLGAVLGSKRIKAIAVRGDRGVPLADPEATLTRARELAARSQGPETEKYRELGTVANLLAFNRFDALPTRNFQGGHFEEAGRLVAEDLAPARRVARRSCASCTIGCTQIFVTPGSVTGTRLEYESLFALGPLCGVADPEWVLRAAADCDAAGLDTISTGGTIAFLMECAERGWIEGRLPSGRDLRFGAGAVLPEAIATLVERQGELGALLALGSRRAGECIGGDAPALAPHVKGMELPGYDPRSLHTMALGLAVGTRGADHNRSGAYEADFSGAVDRRAGGSDAALAAVETEDRAALLDSLILCKFLRGVFGDLYEESARLVQAVTGWDVTADELRLVARRVVHARKCYNLREGWTRDEDTLPARLLDSSAAGSLSRDRLDAMIAAYYQARDWTTSGQVTEDHRIELGLDDPCFDPVLDALS